MTPATQEAPTTTSTTTTTIARPGMGEKLLSAPALINSDRTGQIVVKDEALCREYGMDRDGTCLCHPHVTVFRLLAPPVEDSTSSPSAAATTTTATVVTTTDVVPEKSSYRIEPCPACMAQAPESPSGGKRRKSHIHMHNASASDMEDLLLDSGSLKDDVVDLTWNCPTKKRWHNSMNFVQEEDGAAEGEEEEE